ncbi:TonB family protein [Thalassomonas viridans]|uniref:TonB family protein n=1 Tax=Thalassomonas viridans TaxID=137584 RepID=A0AAE9Z963_9GAMM|nr:energy transducer TonB [Thalassomonas viridans]WDE07382.1 TonB family protein [Thalassomonas viridans]
MPLNKGLLPLSVSTIMLFSLGFASHADAKPASDSPQAVKVKQIATITDAVVEHRVEPRYPTDEARSGREGWTILSYVIETDGSVSNVLVEESSGRRSFDKAAVKAAKKWRYQPALENGKPVQQCQNRVKIDFSIQGVNGSVSRKFLQQYKEIIALIESDELVQAKEKIEQLKTFKQWRLSEEMYFSLARASYARKTGNKKLELTSLERALAANGDHLNPEFYLSTLQHIYNLNLSLNRLHDALATYDKIAGTAGDEALIKRFRENKQKIEDFINGEQDIVLNGAIGKTNTWSHTLVRKAFSLANITGELHKLDVRCANKRHVFTVENNTSWEIPQNWQRCSIYVYGDKQSQFQLIEHPDPAPALAATKT